MRQQKYEKGENKMKNPFMLRKTHEKNCETLRKTHQIDKDRFQKEIQTLEKEIDKLIRPMVDGFMRLKIERSDFDTYAVTTQIESYWVESCLSHGNSEREIRYLERNIAEMIARELHNCLFDRNVIRERIKRFA